LPLTARIAARIERLFPFELTPGQRQAVAEIARDLEQPVPMNRLLHGDVGSGKTVVAAHALLTAVAHGYQSVLMAPTEILARQHWRTLERCLARSQVRRKLLVGGLPPGERLQLLGEIAQGNVDLVVGTQALLEDDVTFAKLGLIVIDEQHKFGVKQRAGLRGLGPTPHALVMSATPIPRTLCMTLHGDLDISLLPDAPPGRQPVHTYLAEPEQREAWWKFFLKKVSEGRQGYIVTPLVETSGSGPAGAEQTKAALAQGALQGLRLGVLHGRLSRDEKDAVMSAFARHELDALVCTTVVEVGIDVPNATLLTVENGERFGLSALHQLRGRISRGSYPGYCCVFSEARKRQADERLTAFQKSTDGFELAEIDFRLRGPGEILGTQQHGLPPLLIADLTRDQAILTQARHDAQLLLARDPHGDDPAFAKLKALVLRRYGDALALSDVG